jgi:16S rRNA (cytosine967-C5)-methyltransferase
LTELLTEAGYQVRPGKYVPDALVIESFNGPLTHLPGYAEGFFHVQDEAAQLATQLLGPFPEPGVYLDGCAGLGGKTCQLAQLVSSLSKISAVEPSRMRLRLLQENLARLRLENVSLFHGRLDEFLSKNPGTCTGVLIDAPCSGTGVIRRQPDIRWNRNMADLSDYTRQQQEILEQGASLVAPGGILVYATCSMEPEENNDVIERFLNGHDDFRVTDCRLYLPAGAEKLVSEDGYFAPTPADGIDGFFGARLVRAG